MPRRLLVNPCPQCTTQEALETLGVCNECRLENRARSRRNRSLGQPVSRETRAAIRAAGLDPLLARTCLEFAARHPEYARPDGAELQCSDAAYAFAWFLNEAGRIRTWQDSWALDAFHLDGRQPHKRTYTRRTSKASPEHVVFRLDRTVFDWTARQYTPDAPFPFIWTDRKGHLGRVKTESWRSFSFFTSGQFA